MKISNKKIFQKLVYNPSADIALNNSKSFHKICVIEPYSFILVDTTLIILSQHGLIYVTVIAVDERVKHSIQELDPILPTE